MYLLNWGSLLLGLIAWILPIESLKKQNKAEHRKWIAFSVASISACAIALFFQIVFQNYLVRINDWSAIADTSSYLVFLSAVLLLITVTLNIIVLIKYRKINGA